MATEFYFRVPEAYRKPSDENAINVESVLSRRHWSQNHGNFAGSIEFSCQISLAVQGLNKRTMDYDYNELVLLYLVIHGRKILSSKYRWR